MRAATATVAKCYVPMTFLADVIVAVVVSGGIAVAAAVDTECVVSTIKFSAVALLLSLSQLLLKLLTQKNSKREKRIAKNFLARRVVPSQLAAPFRHSARGLSSCEHVHSDLRLDLIRRLLTPAVARLSPSVSISLLFPFRHFSVAPFSARQN